MHTITVSYWSPTKVGKQRADLVQTFATFEDKMAWWQKVKDTGLFRNAVRISANLYRVFDATVDGLTMDVEF